jgi:hypothetical protein
MDDADHGAAGAAILTDGPYRLSLAFLAGTLSDKLPHLAIKHSNNPNKSFR